MKTITHNKAMSIESPKDEIESLRQQLADSEAEGLEQARLLGMSGEREAALLSEIEQLKQHQNQLLRQLVASQAREYRLREALVYFFPAWEKYKPLSWQYKAKQALSLSLPSDTTALSAMIAKAGEVMRGRCENHANYYKAHSLVAQGIYDEIRALPGVTLEDLK